MAQKPRDAVVNFFYRNLQRHRAVLPAIARLLLHIFSVGGVDGGEMGMITKNAQQCCGGTRQILKVEVSNYYIKQKKMHLYAPIRLRQYSGFVYWTIFFHTRADL